MYSMRKTMTFFFFFCFSVRKQVGEKEISMALITILRTDLTISEDNLKKSILDNANMAQKRSSIRCYKVSLFLDCFLSSWVA